MAEVERIWNGQDWQIKTIPKELFGANLVCLVCGGSPTAYWEGYGGVLAVCRNCAVEKLPLLIADAIAGNYRASTLTAQRFEPAIPAITGAFWRGAAFALSRRTRLGLDSDMMMGDTGRPPDHEDVDNQSDSNLAR